MRLVLASGSARRAEMLERLGLSFEIAVSGVDETRRPDEPPAVYVERLSRDKATELAAPDLLVLAADTVVVHEGRVIGKPAHPDEARSMLETLQGDTHEVFTGVAVAAWEDSLEVVSTVDVTEVTMMTMTAEEIDDYVSGGEPMGKAGAYAIQGEGGRFVTSVRGSPFTVVGLPIHLIARLFAAVGSDINRFRRRN